MQKVSSIEKPDGYFLVNPISKWPVDKVIDFLAIKQVILTPNEKEYILNNYIDFSKPNIKAFKKLFVVNGVIIYLILRERIEKEEAANNRNLLTPKLTNVFGSPGFTPISNKSNESKSESAKLVMSEFTLEPRVQIDKIYETNLIENKYTIARLESFIIKHPPLLWQIEHFKHFINSIGLSYDIETKGNINELIFYTVEQFEQLFPGNGQLIYNKLRERFVNKDICYIKPKPYIYCW